MRVDFGVQTKALGDSRPKMVEVLLAALIPNTHHFIPSFYLSMQNHTLHNSNSQHNIVMNGAYFIGVQREEE